MSFIISATDDLSKYMHKGMVVVLQSTTYPGTTRELLLPKLGTECGLQVGEDWFLAFSPERVDPGREDYTTKNTPKVMGGLTEACGEVASVWYEGAIDSVFRVSSAEAAEMAKLIIEHYTAEGTDEVHLLYNEFKSVLQQKVALEKLLPIEPPAEEDPFRDASTRRSRADTARSVRRSPRNGWSTSSARRWSATKATMP